MSAEQRSIDKITVAKAVETFYAGKYDLSPRIFREQKKLIGNAVKQRDPSAFQRARSYMTESSIRKILPALLYGQLRAGDREGRAFLKSTLTRKEKRMLLLGFLPYCIRRWLNHGRNAAKEEQIRGFIFHS